MGDMQKSIRFPEGMAEEIQLVADAEDRTFSYVVVRAMERALGDATGDRIPERPAPPRSTSPEVTIKSPPVVEKTAPKAQRRQKASEAMSAALQRQQALNKPKGI